jgi:hypothetical protein
VANEEQVKRLLSGVEGWNKWVKENQNTEIDLSDASLRGARLKGADLFDADLNRANLSGVELGGADLREAYLWRADFTEALLIGTQFAGASFWNTNLANLDLSQAKGLEEADHQAPSTVGTNTLQRSRGKIPEKFLKGCGLSDWEIESAKLYREGLSAKEVDDILYRVHDLRVHQAIQYYSVFISYSTKDQAFAKRLYDDLQNNGVRCWFAPEDMQGGKKIHEQIDAAIWTQERLLLILSESSMNSEWVKTEIAKARKKEVAEKRRVLFPIGLVPFQKIKEWECFDADVGKDSAREIREYFIPDFSQWEEEKVYRPAFGKLLGDLLAKE